MKESLTSYIRLKELIIESLSTSPKNKDCDCGCGGCADNTLQEEINNLPHLITLTLEEKKSILKMVMESYQGITLTEVKSNNNIKEEIKMNFHFYNTLKEAIKIPEFILTEGMLAIFGNIKDFLTGAKIIKDFTGWIQKKFQSLIDYLKPYIDKYIPERVKDWGQWIGNAAKKSAEFTKWVLSAFSYGGLAKLFAQLKYGTVSPSEEEKKCMLMLAKKVYVSILVVLVIAYLIKVGPAIIAWVATKSAIAASATSFNTAITPFITPIGTLFTKAGVTGATKAIGGKLFSAASAASKTSDIKKYQKQIDKKEEKFEIDSKGKSIIQSIKNEFKEYFTGWGEAWDKCGKQDIKKADEKPIFGDFDEKVKYHKLLVKSMKGAGTDEELLFKVLNNLSKNDKLKKEVIKFYELSTTRKLIDDIKDDLSGKELTKALDLLKQ